MNCKICGRNATVLGFNKKPNICCICETKALRKHNLKARKANKRKERKEDGKS